VMLTVRRRRRRRRGRKLAEGVLLPMVLPRLMALGMLWAVVCVVWCVRWWGMEWDLSNRTRDEGKASHTRSRERVGGREGRELGQCRVCCLFHFIPLHSQNTTNEDATHTHRHTQARQQAARALVTCPSSKNLQLRARSESKVPVLT